MRRRLLLSYVVLAVVVLVVLEVPLGILAASRERGRLRDEARRDATALTVLAQEDLERADTHDLGHLARRYRASTGAEVRIVDAAGRPIVQFDPSQEAADDLVHQTRAALRGDESTASSHDEGKPVQVAAVPIKRSDGGAVAGAVVVSVPASGAEHRIRVIIVGLLVIAAVVLAAVIGVGLWLARSVARPLGALEDAARRLGTGDLTVRAAEAGPPELRSMAVTFNRMAERLDELVGAQRRFVADASHQLRSPLTALRLRLEAVDPTDRDRSRDHLEAAGAELGRLSRIVDGLLALARAEGARPEPEAVDVVEAATDRAALWQALSEERRVQLVARLPPRPLLAWDVPGNLEQVLDNLLANALEVAPRGSTVELSVEAGTEMVTVRVADHGPGMSDEQLLTAFEPFWQGDDHPTGAAGLGLAISRQLVRASGGDLVLRNRQPSGLEAVVHLQPLTLR